MYSWPHQRIFYLPEKMHSSLFCNTMTDEEKLFLILTEVVNVIKRFSSSLMKGQNMLEGIILASI